MRAVRVQAVIGPRRMSERTLVEGGRKRTLGHTSATGRGCR